MKFGYAFLLTENRGALHSESATPDHIPEISLDYKKVKLYCYSYKRYVIKTYFKLSLILLCIIFTQFCTQHQKDTKMCFWQLREETKSSSDS